MSAKLLVSVALVFALSSSSNPPRALMDNGGDQQLTRAPAQPGGCSDSDLPANLQHDVSAGNQEWVDGFKAGDVERMVASYSQDSIFCNVAGDCVKGKNAIAALYKDVLANFGPATDATVRSAGLRVDHDLAYESGGAEAHFANGMVRKGRFSTVWKLQSDGHWKIFRNLSLSPPNS